MADSARFPAHLPYAPLATSLLLAAATLPPAPAPAGEHPLVGAPLTILADPDPPGMFMPTDLAVAPDGSRIYVADGTRRRVVVFRADGTIERVIRSARDAPLGNPVGLALDSLGRLWIADADAARILALDAQEQLVYDFPLSSPAAETAAGARVDLTDVAVDSPAGRVWFADNDHHRVGAIDLSGGGVSFIGQSGESLGQFRYPYMLALTSSGDLLVTDVLNGRIAVLSRTGVPAGVLSSYGVGLGELYRPKGVAVDVQGLVWVADGTLGVVQVFQPGGALVDVLRDHRGEPLRFQSPTGLAVDQAGRLYVVELAAHRVQVLAVTRDPSAPPARKQSRTDPLARTQPRACTACHFDWMQPLASGRPTELAAVPPSSPAEPYVARSESCLSCHDTSIADSRLRVWSEQGHRVNIKPPAGMSVAAEFPLVEGKIVCRTCHSAHTRGGSGSDLKQVVFLRAGGSPVELCTGCHGDYARGIDAGMHPLAAAPQHSPHERTRAAPAAGHSAQRHGHSLHDSPSGTLTCLTCHAAHGAPFEQLLVNDSATNDLCLDCHRQQAPQLFADAVRSAHGRMPTLTGWQRRLPAQWSTRLGHDGELLCTSCHVPHAAPFAEYLLAFDPGSADACSACHIDQAAVVASGHDLRISHPDEPNVLGVTARQAGACGACHTAHRFARQPLATPLDPAGRCMTCHAEGRLAGAAHLSDVNHPQVACTQCHDPHQTAYARFLCMPADDNCRGCHAGQARIAGGPHDLDRRPAAWPAQAAAAQDQCLACHRPHGDAEHGLFRLPPALASDPSAAVCAACHADALPEQPGGRALHHPHGRVDVAPFPPLPLVLAADGGQQMSCKTCHDPHAPAAPLLRAEPGVAAQTLCLNCHTEMSNIDGIGHAAESLAAAGFETDGCQPCHAIHGEPGQVELRYLWPAYLSGYDSDVPAATASHYCLGCHATIGPVPPPAVAAHPAVEMFNPLEPGAPGYLPLFDDQGQPDASGQISCRTCHLTHGRSEPLPIPETNPSMSLRELRARQWHIRAFTGNNVCTSCHGFDGLRRYMLFHDPARRSGPITTSGAGPRRAR